MHPQCSVVPGIATGQRESVFNERGYGLKLDVAKAELFHGTCVTHL